MTTPSPARLPAAARGIVTLLLLVASAPLSFAQGISNITATAANAEQIRQVQVGAGTTSATTTGSSGGEASGLPSAGEQGGGAGYACFRIDTPEGRKRCYGALSQTAGQ